MCVCLLIPLCNRYCTTRTIRIKEWGIFYSRLFTKYSTRVGTGVSSSACELTHLENSLVPNFWGSDVVRSRVPGRVLIGACELTHLENSLVPNFWGSDVVRSRVPRVLIGACELTHLENSLVPNFWGSGGVRACCRKCLSTGSGGTLSHCKRTGTHLKSDNLRLTSGWRKTGVIIGRAVPRFVSTVRIRGYARIFRSIFGGFWGGTASQTPVFAVKLRDDYFCPNYHCATPVH